MPTDETSMEVGEDNSSFGEAVADVSRASDDDLQWFSDDSNEPASGSDAQRRLFTDVGGETSMDLSPLASVLDETVEDQGKFRINQTSLT